MMLSHTTLREKLPTLLSLLVVACAVLAGPSEAQTSRIIAGTPHDFSGVSALGGDGCQMCHLPNGGQGNKGGEASFEVYAPGSDLSSSDVLGMVTRLCLSCHDGLGASDDVQFGTNVAGNHPVSVEYDSSSSHDLRSPESVEASGLRLYRDGTSVRIECASCHNPHDNSQGDFLRISNQGSAMCLTCHDR